MAFKRNHGTSQKPSIVIAFNRPQKRAFKVLWFYKHPVIQASTSMHSCFECMFAFQRVHAHASRQLHSLSVVCHLHGCKQIVESIDLHRRGHSETRHWIKLPLKAMSKCGSSQKWEIRGFKAHAAMFYVMDLLLGYDEKESSLLPVPSSSKVNGFCLHQQTVPIPKGWRAGNWELDRWQQLLNFKPDTARIPQGSALLVQLMFDEARVDWPKKRMTRRGAWQFTTWASTKKALPSCRLSILHGKEGTLHPGLSYSFLDLDMLGVSVESLKTVIGLNHNPKLSEKITNTNCGLKKNCRTDWASTKKSRRRNWASTNDTCGTQSGLQPESIASQSVALAATRSLQAALGLFQAGNVSIILKSPSQRLGGGTTAVSKYGNWGMRSVWHGKENRIAGMEGEMHNFENAYRCAVRGQAHVTYWYVPPRDGPCDAPQPTPPPTHSPTSNPTTPSTHALTIHVCDNGSHGCDSGPGGVCISKKNSTKDLLFGNTTWKCGCKPSYVCTSGCSVDHKGHTCTLTKAPKKVPAGTHCIIQPNHCIIQPNKGSYVGQSEILACRKGGTS